MASIKSDVPQGHASLVWGHLEEEMGTQFEASWQGHVLCFVSFTTHYLECFADITLSGTPQNRPIRHLRKGRKAVFVTSRPCGRSIADGGWLMPGLLDASAEERPSRKAENAGSDAWSSFGVQIPGFKRMCLSSPGHQFLAEPSPNKAQAA